MEVRQLTLKGEVTAPALSDLAAIQPDLLLVFGSIRHFSSPDFFGMLRAAFPQTLLAGCSSAGEISDFGLNMESVVLTALRFKYPALRLAAAELGSMEASLVAGERLASQLKDDEKGAPLRHVLLFGQGVNINGSALIEGLTRSLGAEVVVSGGLAADDGTFQRTWILTNQGVFDRQVVAVGFYGEGVRLGTGSCGGWLRFGPERCATRAEGNVLYELDGEPALDVYKRYLGEYSKALPSSALLFPLSLLGQDRQEMGLVRTVLNVDEAQKSLILAGDVVEQGYMQFMYASTEALVEGAMVAAEAARDGLSGVLPGLTLLVSCVGRKLVMGARVEEETEAVADVFGHAGSFAGFYSHGEISPHLPTKECRLHNQTMTITSLCEVT